MCVEGHVKHPWSRVGVGGGDEKEKTNSGVKCLVSVFRGLARALTRFKRKSCNNFSLCEGEVGHHDAEELSFFD
jgi:hypothetical protein